MEGLAAILKVAASAGADAMNMAPAGIAGRVPVRRGSGAPPTRSDPRELGFAPMTTSGWQRPAPGAWRRVPISLSTSRQRAMPHDY